MRPWPRIDRAGGGEAVAPSQAALLHLLGLGDERIVVEGGQLERRSVLHRQVFKGAVRRGDRAQGADRRRILPTAGCWRTLPAGRALNLIEVTDERKSAD